MNNADISSALLLLAQQQQQQQQQASLASAQGPSKAALLSLLAGQQPNPAPAATESDTILQLLQHQAQQKQREEQEKIFLLQKIQQELNKPQAPPADDLALLLLQQQQKQQQLASLASLGAAASSSNPFLAATNVSANLAAAPQGSQLDAATLSKLLSAQQRGTTPHSVAAAANPIFAAAQPRLDFGATTTTSALHHQMATAGAGKRKGRTGTFPAKLHQMLSDLERQEGGTEIASFLPHGRAFAIHKPRDFVKHVMPKYFRMSRFSSFQRQLNLYDFQRITEGPDKGSYYHELFVQGRPILSTMMKRNKIKGIKNKKMEAAASNNNAAADVNDGHEDDEGDDEEV